MAQKRRGLTQREIDRCQPKEKEYELRDTKVPYLYYRVRPNDTRKWVVKYTDPITGKTWKKYTLDVPTNLLDDARAAAQKFYHDLTAGKNPANARANLVKKSLTLNEAVDLYKKHISQLRTGEEVIKDIQSICRWNKLGDKAINEITKTDISLYIQSCLDRGLTKRTINKKISLLYGMMAKLYKEDVISPADVKLPNKPQKLKEDDSRKSRTYFEPHERKRLIETAKTMKPSWLYPAIIISLNTGLRPGTLFRLRWSDIDFNSQNMHLRAEIMKTKDDWVIPYNDHVAEILQTLKSAEETDGCIIKDANGKPIPTDSGRDGWSDVFKRLCKLADIKGKTWYHMRHDFASQLVMAGVDLYTVKDLMCHKNITTTQIYAHLAPDLKRAAVARLDSI